MDQTNGKGHDNWAARWSAERVEKLKELWPIMSASQIGRSFGVSRMAIIGKVHRLGLALKKSDRLLAPKRGGYPRKPIYVAPPRISAPPVAETVLPDMPAPEFLNRRIEDLEVAECHYPQGDRVPYRFCGAPCDGSSSFCAYHKRLSYYRPLPSRRDLERCADWWGG